MAFPRGLHRSGFAGLAYEATWTRQFTLHLGHTTAAVYDLGGAAFTRLGRADEARSMFDRSLTFDADRRPWWRRSMTLRF